MKHLTITALLILILSGCVTQQSVEVVEVISYHPGYTRHEYIPKQDTIGLQRYLARLEREGYYTVQDCTVTVKPPPPDTVKIKIN